MDISEWTLLFVAITLLFPSLALASAIKTPAQAAQSQSNSTDHLTTTPASQDLAIVYRQSKVLRRMPALDAQFSEFNIHLPLFEQFAANLGMFAAVERFFRGLMGKSTRLLADHALFGDGIEFKAHALVLQYRYLRNGRATSSPWPMVLAFAQFMMQRAQRGRAGRFLGQVASADGLVIQVVFDIVETAGQAIGQALLDSAYDMHGPQRS